MAVATTAGTKDIPSNVWLYHVANPAAPEALGVASLTLRAPQGSPTRISIKGNRIYAGTSRKGIHVIDVDALRGGVSGANLPGLPETLFGLSVRGRNVDFTPIGGSDLHARALPKVWRGFRAMQRPFGQ